MTDKTNAETVLLPSNNFGKFHITIAPFYAQCVLSQSGVEKYRWMGTNSIDTIVAGRYDLTISRAGYFELTKTVQIQWKQITTENIQMQANNLGMLQMTILPANSECVLSLNGVEKYRWSGSITIDSIPIGTYSFIAKATGYFNYTKTIEIVWNQASTEQIQVISDRCVLVSGGSFQMGSTSGRSDEQPVHKVNISSFYISKYEVTAAEYRVYCTAFGKSMPISPDWRGWKDNDPIVNVSYNEALAYCTWTGTRLPTEAEWEYAARGGKQSNGYTYSGSNSIDAVAWYTNNSSDIAQPVGIKVPNELGIYDMSGNVWEWCNDLYGDYSSNEQTNPKGSYWGWARVLRGGSYYSDDNNCRVSYRKFSSPDFSCFFYGFRVVRL